MKVLPNRTPATKKKKQKKIPLKDKNQMGKRAKDLSRKFIEEET